MFTVARQAHAAVAFVTCPAMSLQAAINAAHPGDTLVISGTCKGNFLIIGKNLTLQGAFATLDGKGSGTTLTVSGRSTVNVRNLTITNGVSSTGGGGIETGPGTTLNVTASTIRGNATSFGGGGIDANGAVLNLYATGVSNNTGAGAGIFGSHAAIHLTSSAVDDNTAPTGTQGGGIFVDYGSLTLSSSTVTGNHCVDASASGGGIFAARATVSIDHSAVSSNSAPDDGGGVFYEGGGSLTVTNSTISDNHTASNGGGGIFNLSFAGDAVTVIQDSTISNNTTTFGNGGGVANYGGYGHTASTVISYSTVTGNSAVTGSGGNVSSEGSFLGGPGGTATLSLSQSEIAGGTAEEGGGVSNQAVNGTASLTVLAGTDLANNTASLAGGGVYNDAAAALTVAPITTFFHQNSPTNCFPESDQCVVVGPNPAWAGYADYSDSGPFSSLSAKWTVPTVVSPPLSGGSLTWIGLGGVGSSLLQIGTAQLAPLALRQQYSFCGSVLTQYCAWWEAVDPGSSKCQPQHISMTISPGDTIQAALQPTSLPIEVKGCDETATNRWLLTIADGSQTSSMVVGFNPNPHYADWIEEAPTLGSYVVPLADFGKVTFGDMLLDGSPPFATGSIVQSTKSAVCTNDETFGQPQGYFALPSIPNAAGDGFSVTWGSGENCDWRPLPPP